MRLTKPLSERYCKEQMNAAQAQRHAQEIAFAPVVFQVSRLMVKFGILEYLTQHYEGVTQSEIAKHTGLSNYAAQVLLEASLSIGIVLTKDDKYVISKTGWFLLNDPLVKSNLNFNHDVNYLGLFNLEEALVEGKPAGLKVFGEWPTIYEGLSSLPEHVLESWFGFDHFYSDGAFSEALKIIFDGERKVRRLLDVGGNTGRWALQCVGYNEDVEVTIMDLPQQLALMREHTAGKKGAERIQGYPDNLLNEEAKFPATTFDAIWMSQFLDCFSEEEVTSICRRATESMNDDTRLYIMETFWDRQRFETAAYCLTLTSVYFTAMANGNSKMYHADDMARCVRNAGLEIEEIIDGVGSVHSIMVCKKRNG